MALRVRNYEIRRMDKLNLRAWEYRGPNARGSARAKSGEMRWYPLEAYFGNLESALAWLSDRLVMDDIEREGEVGIAELIEEYHAIKDDIREALDGRGQR